MDLMGGEGGALWGPLKESGWEALVLGAGPGLVR